MTTQIGTFTLNEPLTFSRDLWQQATPSLQSTRTDLKAIIAALRTVATEFRAARPTASSKAVDDTIPIVVDDTFSLFLHESKSTQVKPPTVSFESNWSHIFASDAWRETSLITLKLLDAYSMELNLDEEATATNEPIPSARMRVENHIKALFGAESDVLEIYLEDEDEEELCYVVITGDRSFDFDLRMSLAGYERTIRRDARPLAVNFRYLPHALAGDASSQLGGSATLIFQR